FSPLPLMGLEIVTNKAIAILMAEFLFSASICMLFIAWLLHQLKRQRALLLHKKEKAKQLLTKKRRAVLAKQPPSGGKPGPDPDQSTNKGYAPPLRTPRSETPPNAMLKQPGSGGNDDPAAEPGAYRLAVDISFVASVLASMAHPLAAAAPTPASLPLTLHSPLEAPMSEGTDLLLPAGGPTKLARRSSAATNSDPAGASGDMQQAGGGGGKKKHHKRGRPAHPAPSYDMVAAIRHGGGEIVPGGPGPKLPVGPRPARTRPEMGQSDRVL
ncbi:hypothetical protein PENTCL1PPCAC_8974, partial [Pristionchus entomophagus]